MIKKISEICINKSTSISQGVNALNSGDAKLLLIVEDKKLVGVVSDGDIRRRFISAGKNSYDSIDTIMTRNPIVVKGFDKRKAIQLMKGRVIDAVPVVNDAGEPIGVYTWEDLLERDGDHDISKINVPVVIMAGGKGTRLKPYTNVLPKPLIPIGDETIIERVMHSFMQYGCNRFIVSINYKKDLIKAYFDTVERNYNVEYIEEDMYLGTCGSLSLLNLNETFIVSNCDILLNVDYSDLYRDHKEHNRLLTVVTCKKKVEIPYGVFELKDDSKLSKIIEKPEMEYNINTGVYMFEPELIHRIPKETAYQMDEMIQKLLDSNEKVGAYSISGENWSDMGQFDGMYSMIKNYTIG